MRKDSIKKKKYVYKCIFVTMLHCAYIIRLILDYGSRR